MFIVRRYFHLGCFCSKGSIGRPAEEFKLGAFFCHPNPLESAILAPLKRGRKAAICCRKSFAGRFFFQERF